MVAETALAPSEDASERERTRKLALLRAIGLDKVSEPERELALNIAQRYDLDPLLRHLVLIDGRVYITRDGLLHVAHRSGKFDGLEVTPAELDKGFWRSTASVYRKDMARPFTYPGRYPESGRNKAYGPEMAIKVAEVMALRRAFDVSAPVAEERWAADEPPTEAVAQEAPKSLRERAREAAEATKPAAAAQDPQSSSSASPVSGDASEEPEPDQLPLDPVVEAELDRIVDELP